MDLLKQAERTTGGRPLSLDDWIQSEDFNRGRIRKDEKFHGYQLERLNACSPEARRLARALALLPNPLPRGLRDCAIIFETSAADLEELLKELAHQHLFLRTGNEYWFVHEEIQETIRADMSPAVRSGLAKSLIAGLQVIDPGFMESQSRHSVLAAAVLAWTDNHQKTYQLNSRWGVFFVSHSEFLLAWEHFQRALEAAETLGDKSWQSNCLNNLGGILDLWGRPRQALDYFVRSLDIDRPEGNRRGVAANLNNIGAIHRTFGKKEDALRYYREAVSICQEVGDWGGQASSLSGIATVYSEFGQDKEALEVFQPALLICREVGDRKREASTLNNIGAVHYDLGQKKEALWYFQEALPIRRKVSDRRGEANTLNSIGAVYSDLVIPAADPYAFAPVLRCYRQALAICREVGDRGGEARQLNNIGTICDSIGAKDIALRNYEQALSICLEVGDRNGEANSLRNMAGLRREQGMLAEAISLMEKVITIDEGIHHPDLEKDRAVLDDLRQLLLRATG